MQPSVFGSSADVPERVARTYTLEERHILLAPTYAWARARTIARHSAEADATEAANEPDLRTATAEFENFFRTDNFVLFRRIRSLTGVSPPRETRDYWPDEDSNDPIMHVPDYATRRFIESEMIHDEVTNTHVIHMNETVTRAILNPYGAETHAESLPRGPGGELLPDQQQAVSDYLTKYEAYSEASELVKLLIDSCREAQPTNRLRDPYSIFPMVLMHTVQHAKASQIARSEAYHIQEAKLPVQGRPVRSITPLPRAERPKVYQGPRRYNDQCLIDSTLRLS
jgi:hypothetical protein